MMLTPPLAGFVGSAWLLNCRFGADSVENPGHTVGISGAASFKYGHLAGIFCFCNSTRRSIYDAIVYSCSMDNGSQTATEHVYIDNAVLVVPEPATIALLGMGLALPLYLIRRRK